MDSQTPTTSESSPSPPPPPLSASLSTASSPPEASSVLAPSHHAVEGKALPPWYPHFRGRPLYHGNREACAWALDGIGRAVSFIGSGAFLGTALLRIATEAAGCLTEAPEGETEIPECNERIYGIRPSSLLTTYTMVMGVASASALPLIGAIVDYTKHRLLVGRITSAIFCLLLFPQLFISEDTWLAIACVQIVISLVGWLQTSITYAYLPELTPDELRLNDYTRNFTVTSFLSMVIYLAVVIVGVQLVGLGDDDVATARIGTAVALVVNAVLLYAAWGVLFQPRPALHTLEEGRSIWTAGFVELWSTINRIAKNQRALRWFYIGVAFSDASIQALATIAITYMTDTLQFSGQENGIAILCMLLGSVPGGMLSNKVTVLTDPFRSSMASLLVLIVATILFAVFLSGPGQQTETYFLALIWGIGTGWKWTCDRFIASSIIPPGRDAEMMSFFLFSGQVFSWVPPLIFTAMNEAGISQQISLGGLAVYFCFSLGAYIVAGDYETARKEVDRDSAFGSSSTPNTATNNGNNPAAAVKNTENESQPSTTQFDVPPA
mmetsp:Transcript_18090/g.51439  ORF Transcript_18090/g.51439 Transcript_18090/m.51439 type:complete len:552 (+) Transcript_18090:235-1890(+)